MMIDHLMGLNAMPTAMPDVLCAEGLMRQLGAQRDMQFRPGGIQNNEAPKRPPENFRNLRETALLLLIEP